MKENKYDDNIFFQKYSQMSRSQKGLAGAGEWETLKKMLPDFKGKRVLDLGCGYGWHCIYAMENGASSVVGVDISHKMLEVAKGKTHFPQIEYDRWQGEYELDGYDAHVIVSSTAGIGDVNIETRDGYTIIVESKKGKKSTNGQEYPLMREAIGQLMTGSAFGDTIRPVVAVPYTEKSNELARRWIQLPQIRNAGIHFFLVKEDGNLCIVK